MARKILSGLLIGLSAVLLVLSVMGVVAAWVYNEPLTQKATTQLEAIDTQMEQTQASMKIAETEIQRALRIVDAAQTALDKLSQQTATASNVFEGMKDTIDKQLLPGLEKTRTQVVSAHTTLQSIQDVLNQINTNPLLSSIIPDSLITSSNSLVQNLIDTTSSIDTQISGMETMAKQASTFVGDTGYLLGGDLSETHDNMQTLLTNVQAYDAQITDWRSQVAYLQRSVPGWIDTASIVLTVFLLWFAFSQFGLILHGLTIWRGGDPIAIVRRQGVVVAPAPVVVEERTSES